MSTTNSSTSAPSYDSTARKPIAVVGMACRLSGIATSPENLWQMMSNGLTGWTSNASSRFRMDSFWHPDADLNGSVSSPSVRITLWHRD
jgi:acyl transferase domain-containing protein